MLAEEARARPGPPDWAYVNNFMKPDRPVAIELPSGRAAGFKDAMHKLVEDLKSAAPAAFQSEDYQTRRGTIDETFQKKQFEAFTALSRAVRGSSKGDSKSRGRDMRFTPTIFAKLLEPIDRRRLAAIVARHDGDAYDKSFFSWDHLVTLIFAQLSDLDSLRALQAGWNASSQHHYHLASG